MPSTATEPDRLFDRLWQPRHSFRPRRGPGRRWGMVVLLVLLLAIIATYWFVTDPVRVRLMAEAYLSQLIGGRVRVGGASLSIFEGLHLWHVSVRVPGPESIDSTLFVVESLDIQYDPATLLRGKLDATRLIATGPHVYLVEDLDNDSWNYQRLQRSALHRRGLRPSADNGQPLALPEIVLRNAKVEYSELRHGHYTSRGMLGLEGRFSPSSESNQYLFQLQSRGASEGVGPVLTGDVRLGTGQVTASLQNLNFGPDMLAMLPSEVRQLWESHHLQGRLNIPVFNYTPATKKTKSSFLLKTEFNDVNLVVRPRELASATAARRLERLEQSIQRTCGSGFVYDDLSNHMRGVMVPPNIAVDHVTGTCRFDPAGVSFSNVAARIGGIPLIISGITQGYDPDVPFHLHAASPPEQVVRLVPQLRYLSTLPSIARKIYGMFRPSGVCTFEGDINRPAKGDRPRVTGVLTALDGGFTCEFFPYPIRHVTGQLRISADPRTGDEQLLVDNLTGVGIAGGTNANTRIWVNGWVGPFDKRLGCDVKITSDHVVGDAALVAAFPPEVRDALAAFRSPVGAAAAASNPYPQFAGQFSCDVAMPIALGSKVSLTTDIHLADASGTLVAFPYPFVHATGNLHISDGQLDIANLAMHRGGASVRFDGQSTWPTSLHPDVKAATKLAIHAKAIPINRTLIDALPPEKAKAIRKLGIGGKIDIDGDISVAPNSAADKSNPLKDHLTFALDLGLADGFLKNPTGAIEADHLNGHIQLTPTGASTTSLTGQRGSASLTGNGDVQWADGQTTTRFEASAKGLALDTSLHAFLPAHAQSAWDAMNPRGSVDAALSYASSADGSEPHYTLTLHPDHTHVDPAFAPYALDDCTGTITVTPQRIRIKNLAAKHGLAHLTLNGIGANGSMPAWNLSLNSSNVLIDDALRKALPAAVTHLMDEVSLHGRVSLDLTKLDYRAGTNGTTNDCNADIAGTLQSKNAALDLGMPVKNVDGNLAFTAAVRSGSLAELHGKLALVSLDLAGRPVQNLAADVTRPLGESTLRIDHIQGQVAGGEFAGQASLKFPDHSPTQYALNFVLRNADVRDIATKSDVRGQLSASLALQGLVNQPGTRRGRGDVQVVGQRMYQIPLLLGLMEVTDLSLPSTDPFNEASARYNVDGQRINFDQIQMRSNTMLMNGSGWMDFGSKKVRLNFTTDSANLPQLPFLHDLWQGAKQELLQIQVRGTIKAPKVDAASFHTFTTTVDEVFSGSNTEK